MTDTPRVWVACLASYNAGRLIGEWVDATDVDNLHEAKGRVSAEAVKAAKAAGEYPVYFGDPEEFAIHDYDGFGSLSSTLGEYPDWETVANVGALIEAHGEAFLAYLEACEVDLGEVTEDGFHEAYGGEFDSEENYARDYVDSCGWAGASKEVLDALDPYLDWESIARELFDHGPYTLHKGYVFNTWS